MPDQHERKCEQGISSYFLTSFLFVRIIPFDQHFGDRIELFYFVLKIAIELDP